MAFVNRYKSYVAKAQTGWTGTAGQTVNTSAIVVGEHEKICCLCSVTLDTANVNVALKWQASADNSTWHDVADWNNAAYVTINSTGSSATTTKWLVAPAGLTARFIRVQGLTSGAGTAVGANDHLTAQWHVLLKD